LRDDHREAAVTGIFKSERVERPRGAPAGRGTSAGRGRPRTVAARSGGRPSPRQARSPRKVRRASTTASGKPEDHRDHEAHGRRRQAQDQALGGPTRSVRASPSDPSENRPCDEHDEPQGEEDAREGGDPDDRPRSQRRPLSTGCGSPARRARGAVRTVQLHRSPRRGGTLGAEPGQPTRHGHGSCFPATLGHKPNAYRPGCPVWSAEFMALPRTRVPYRIRYLGTMSGRLFYRKNSASMTGDPDSGPGSKTGGRIMADVFRDRAAPGFWLQDAPTPISAGGVAEAAAGET